jgi:hypothetical protein
MGDPEAGGEAGEPGRSSRHGRGRGLAAWLAWIRAEPVLALAVIGFCVVAIVALALSLPRGTLSRGRTSRGAGGASVVAPASPASVAPRDAPLSRAPVSRAPDSAADTAPGAEPGPWVEKAASPASARGSSLVYRYRTLPPGGESQYEWIAQVQGARSLLDGIEVVTWRMEPAAKNGADFVSRDRAADGFPLFGHGPGGWFELSATVRYRDGAEETLTRRIELFD